jgi:hypothetical protein
MKKTIIWVLIALVSGALLGKLTFDKYENIDLQNVISFNNEVYMLKYGTYSTVEEMQASVTKVERYVYIEKTGEVSAYVAISSTNKNINKIKDVYSSKGITLSVEKVTINNDAFIQNLNEYEKLLEVAEDENSLLMIQNQILSCYEDEVVKDE